MIPVVRAAIVALGLLSSGCVTFKYERHLTHEALPEDAIAGLEIGTSDIGDALRALGAPLYVWEGQGDAVVLAWGHENRREVGFSVSVPVLDQGSASFDYDDVSSRLEGYVLLFGADLKLELVRAGLLRDLARVSRRRPGTPE